MKRSRESGALFFCGPSLKWLARKDYMLPVKQYSVSSQSFRPIFALHANLQAIYPLRSRHIGAKRAGMQWIHTFSARGVDAASASFDAVPAEVLPIPVESSHGLPSAMILHELTGGLEFPLRPSLQRVP